MKLVTVVRVWPSEPQALLSFIERFNDACTHLSRIAFEERLFHWLPLQRRAYREVRERFGLSAAATLVAIRKVAYAYKVKERRKALIRFRRRGAIPIFSHSYKRDGTVSFSGFRLPFTARLGVSLSGKHQATLSYLNGKFFLHQVIEVPTPPPFEPGDYLGVDLGVTNLLTDSEGLAYSGEEVERKRRIFAHRRRNLQKKRTRSAKRKLRLLRRKQSRYQRDVNHCIARRVVAKAKRHSLGIALERIQGIRGRITAGRRQRARLSNWSFRQLQGFIIYKAALAGVPVVFVDPKDTSRACPACGLVERGNRHGQNFECRRCGFAGAADHIAALNIRARARGTGPMGAVGHHQLQVPLLVMGG